MDINISNIDITIVLCYVIFVLFMAIWIGRKKKGSEDYFLAGRNMKWHMIGLSLFASNVSSTTLVGLTGAGYGNGFSVFTYEWMAVLVLILFAIFFLPYYLKNKIFTIPEYLEKRYNTTVRMIVSGLALIMNVFIDSAATLFAGSLVIRLLFPQIELETVIILIACTAGIYTMIGGLESVMYADSIQASVVIIGALIILFEAMSLSGGLDKAVAITGVEHLQMFKSVGDSSLPLEGLFGVFIIGFYFWSTNQFITQRTLASKNVKNGQWGALFAGFLKVLTVFIFIVPGAYARVLYPDLERADLAYPTMMTQLLPTGILGVVLAGFIAALISSVDSSINSASTLFTMDFVSKIKKNASSRYLMIIGRISTIILMGIAALWAPHIEKFPTLWDYLQQALSIISPPIVALFVAGLFDKKSNATGAVSTLVFGLLFAIFQLVFNKQAWMPHYLILATINFFTSLIITCLISRLARPAIRIPTNLLWSWGQYKEETQALKSLPWYINYRVLSVLLLIFLVFVLAYFQFYSMWY